ncbi:MAG: hypothetical protein ACRDRK_01430, partial [Pseudonocardia sp.]
MPRSSEAERRRDIHRRRSGDFAVAAPIGDDFAVAAPISDVVEHLDAISRSPIIAFVLDEIADKALPPKVDRLALPWLRFSRLLDDVVTRTTADLRLSRPQEADGARSVPGAVDLRWRRSEGAGRTARDTGNPRIGRHRAGRCPQA